MGLLALHDTRMIYSRLALFFYLYLYFRCSCSLLVWCLEDAPALRMEEVYDICKALAVRQVY